MPPLATWYGGRDEIETFLAGWPLSGAVALEGAPRARQRRSRRSPSTAGTRTRRPTCRSRSTSSRFRGEQISDVTAFIIRTPPRDHDREVIARMPEQPASPLSLEAAFQNFGVPDRLD